MIDAGMKGLKHQSSREFHGILGSRQALAFHSSQLETS